MPRGVDVSQPTHTFKELYQAGFTFAIIRAYRSIGVFDANCMENIARATEAGMDVEVYIFPKFKTGDPERQAEDILRSLGEWSGRIWIDVENAEEFWSKDIRQNQEFLARLFDELDRRHVPWGVYTNWRHWANIVGRDWDRAAGQPLWYCHWDSQEDFQDFRHFGGWTIPSMKQYSGDATVCNTRVDLNWRQVCS